jgi:hypothetical protein
VPRWALSSFVGLAAELVKRTHVKLPNLPVRRRFSVSGQLFVCFCQSKKAGLHILRSNLSKFAAFLGSFAVGCCLRQSLIHLPSESSARYPTERWVSAVDHQDSIRMKLT